MSARNWTKEQRMHQAEAIRKWKPWEKSTGPRSLKGKAQVSQNAFAGSQAIQLRKTFNALKKVLKDQRKWLE